MKEEFWKYIEGYEERYSISSFGRVRSEKRNCNFVKGKTRIVEEKILKQSIEKDGYLTVGLSKNSKTKTFKVHRLVALTFLRNEENKEQVNHIDGNKQNNNIENLEWCTMSENMKHAVKNGLNNCCINMRKPVICLNNGIVYVSITDCELKTGIDDCTIINSCKKLRPTRNGLDFRYYEPISLDEIIKS